jgi:hypothetical protein
MLCAAEHLLISHQSLTTGQHVSIIFLHLWLLTGFLLVVGVVV